MPFGVRAAFPLTVALPLEAEADGAVADPVDVDTPIRETGDAESMTDDSCDAAAVSAGALEVTADVASMAEKVAAEASSEADPPVTCSSA